MKRPVDFLLSLCSSYILTLQVVPDSLCHLSPSSVIYYILYYWTLSQHTAVCFAAFGHVFSLSVFLFSFWRETQACYSLPHEAVYWFCFSHRPHIKAPFEDRLHSSETLFSASLWFCTFWKIPGYYSAGYFKHYSSSF